jgi:hypothetical protein
MFANFRPMLAFADEAVLPTSSSQALRQRLSCLWEGNEEEKADLPVIPMHQFKLWTHMFGL